MKTFLTKNGILASHDNQAAFFSNSGDFVRECSQAEFCYLTQEILLPEIDVRGSVLFPEIAMALMHAPKWHFLFSTEDRDDTNYKWETSCNGGDYTNFDRHNYFVRLNAGKVEFACLTESYSSAEFHQTWNGSYQNANDCNWTTLIDVEGDWRLSEWQQEEKEASLLQYGQLCRLEDLFQPTTYVPSRDEEDITPQETPISFAEYLHRWRLICNITGKMPSKIAKRRVESRISKKYGRRR